MTKVITRKDRALNDASEVDDFLKSIRAKLHAGLFRETGQEIGKSTLSLLC